MKQVWFGSIIGIVFCLIIGGVFIGVFYGLGHNIWVSTIICHGPIQSPKPIASGAIEKR